MSHTEVKRILAVDFGTKRVGLALTDPLGLTVQPLSVLSYKSDPQFFLELKGIVQEKSVELVVMGIPKRSDGVLGPESVRYIRIAEGIGRECSVPVRTVDESFTSREAEDFLIRVCGASRKRRKKVKDMLAACLILGSYLELRGHQP